MSSRWELDDGITSIKSAWQREHTARANLEKMLENSETENAKLRELVARLICHIENPPCESCMSEMSCAGGEGLTNCDEYQFMVCDARKLGVDA